MFRRDTPMAMKRGSILVKRKTAAVLAIMLWVFLLLCVGYTARQGGWADHPVLLILTAVIPWAIFLTWFGLKATSRPLVRSLTPCLLTVCVVQWLGWAGVPLTRPLLIGLFIAVVFLELLLIPAISFFRQRRLVLRFNAAYAAKEAGGSCAELLAEIERCEEGLKNCSGLDITYGGIPFKYMILLHKAALLREMGRKQESIALYQEVCPKIKDPETQKALQEEVRRLKEEWP